MEEEIFKKSKIIERSPVKGMEKSESEEWMNEMRNGFERMAERAERMMKEVRKEFKEQEKMLNDKMEEMWKEFKEQWREWREEREELKRNIEEMKKRIENLEEKGKRKEDSLMQNGVGGNKIMDKVWKVDELERRLDIREKEERRRNMLIRDVEIREGSGRKVIEKILGVVGVKVMIEEIKR